jgi:hypothetical protein
VMDLYQHSKAASHKSLTKEDSVNLTKEILEHV